MAGYVYGFLFGFTIVFISALAGAIVCFYFCRRWFKPQVRKLLAKNKNFKSVLRTVERKGFRLLVLIRLAPYPFNVMNALLSATHVSLKTFILATALSLSKLTLHVYVGSTLSSLTGDEGDDGDGGDQDPSKGHGKKVKIVLMVLSIFLGFGVGGYVWMVTKREIAITEASRLERRRRRRREQSLRRELDSDQFANNNGIELTDHHRMHHIPDVDLTSRELSVDGMPGNNGTGRDDSRQTGYRDEEDDVHERQSLFGSLGFGQNQRQQQGDDWRNVGANIDSSTDSEDSDFLDDDDEEEEEEREGNEADIMNALERGENFDQQEQDDGGALDFSAHHDGLINSPWQDDEEEEEAEVDNAGLLNPNKGSNVWW
ncbi:Transmembrane protein 64 [Entomortierella lignicola]|nr:Transmembrane protein 64 [Entomortierella lignicola]